MPRPIDPKKRRIHQILYAGIAVALVGGIGYMLSLQTEMLGGVIQPGELAKHVGQDPYHYVVIDVRTPEEFRTGHIPFSMNVPKDQIGRRLGELAQAQERQIVVACGYDALSCGDAVPLLQRSGFRSVLFVEGGVPAWEKAGLPLSTKDDSPFHRMVE